MRIIVLGEVDSTYSYLEREASKINDTVMVTAENQTAGRGQRGNSWESAPGENMTFSVLYHPIAYHAADQFSISEATALAVRDFLLLHSVNAKVKWPNDIYVGDSKICGILIKNSLMGAEIAYSILGVGININQTLFLSDAPNPVSLRQLTGKSYNLDSLTKEMSDCLEHRLTMIYGMEKRRKLHNEFMCNLWRGDGIFYPFCDSASEKKFDAVIDGIDLEGVLTLRLHDGTSRNYRFKEVTFLLQNP